MSIHHIVTDKWTCHKNEGFIIRFILVTFSLDVISRGFKVTKVLVAQDSRNDSRFILINLII